MESNEENGAAIFALLLLKKIRKREKDPCGKNLGWGKELI